MPVASSDLLNEYLVALIDGDARRAGRLVDEALDTGLDVAEVYLGVLQPALTEVGASWERGELSVAQEHLATAATEAIAARISPGLGTGDQRGTIAVVSCTPGEMHCVGARFVSDFLESDGWEVLTLGASTPRDDLVDMARVRRPHVVALSTTMPQNLNLAEATFGALRELQQRPLLVAGGGAYRGDPERALRIGADAFAGGPDSLRERLIREFGAR